MIIFLYGEDTYRLSKKLEEIIGEYKHQKKGLGFCGLDMDESDPKAFFSELAQNSLFQEKKFFVVKNPIANKDCKEMLLKRWGEVAKSSHNMVFVQEGKVLKTDRLLTAMKKGAEVQEFSTLQGERLTAWIANEFSLAGCSFEPEAVRAVAELAGSDLWRTRNEIQKLAHRFQGKKITVEDVRGNINAAIDENIFKTIDAIAQKDKRQAFYLISEHLEKGDHPLYLLAMIVGQIRNLLLVKSCHGGMGGADTAKRLGIHPYVLSKTLNQARRFEEGELKAIYKRIFDIDLGIKVGKISPEAGLDLVIAQI